MIKYAAFANTNMGIQKRAADFSAVSKRFGFDFSALYKADAKDDKASYFNTNTNVFEIVSKLYNKNNKLICFTEDHSLVSGIFKALPKNSGLLYIDAHTDIHSFQTSISARPHGMSLGTLMGLEGDVLKGSVNPEDLVIIGAKNFEVEEYDNLIDLGVENVFGYYPKDKNFYNLFTQEKKSLQEINSLIKEVSNRTNAMGISLDLDVLDRAKFDGAHYKVGNLPLYICKNILEEASSLSSLIEITELNTQMISDATYYTLSTVLQALGLMKINKNQDFKVVA